jgi:hypothetical protein
VADPYLRFWLAFLEPHMAEVERMRGDLTLARIEKQWASWRGRAVEPLVREALARLLPDGGLPAAPTIGGYWTRGNDVEIDIVGADRGPVAKRLLFLGSIKWLETSRSTPTTWPPCTNTGQRSPTNPSPRSSVAKRGQLHRPPGRLRPRRPAPSLAPTLSPRP